MEPVDRARRWNRSIPGSWAVLRWPTVHTARLDRRPITRSDTATIKDDRELGVEIEMCSPRG
jgi:hypothetical protein